MCVCLYVFICVSCSIHGHAGITNAVRSSEYFQFIPPLSAECVELDGDASSLPVIFEDVYAEQVVKSLVETTDPSLAAMTDLQPDDSISELRRSTMADNSQVTMFSKQSRVSRTSVASTMSSVSEIGHKSSKLRLRTRPDSLRRSGGDSLVATDEPDCTLVGYRKLDISCKEYRPTVELGTLTSTDGPHTQSLVGSGVVMQPSLLFSAVSLPTLHSNALVSCDASVSLTGSMPTLPASDNSSSESELTPYWRSQQGKAQLVAQHSNEATAAAQCYINTDTLSASSDHVNIADSNSVAFSLGSDLDSAVGDDLNTTVGTGLQRAVGNDLYMAEGIDLDTTLVDDLRTAESVECVATLSAAVCDSQQQSADITSDNADISQDNAEITGDNADTAVTNDALCNTSTPAAASKLSLMVSATEDSERASQSLESTQQICAPAHSDIAAESRDMTSSTAGDVNTDGLSSSLPPSSVTCSSSAAADATSCSESCELKDESSSGKSGTSPESGASNEVNGVSGDVDELSVVIPSSCDSMSDDERYLSGQCTLLELIHEANSADQARLGSDDVAQRLSGATQQQQQQQQQQPPQEQQQPQEHGVDLNDGEVTDLTERKQGDMADLTERRPGVPDRSAKRLISVVSDDTIHFIGAKEKLRKQLNYSGHFYRFLLRDFYLLFVVVMMQCCTLVTGIASGL